MSGFTRQLSPGQSDLSSFANRSCSMFARVLGETNCRIYLSPPETDSGVSHLISANALVNRNPTELYLSARLVPRCKRLRVQNCLNDGVWCRGAEGVLTKKKQAGTIDLNGQLRNVVFDPNETQKQDHDLDRKLRCRHTNWLSRTKKTRSG